MKTEQRCVDENQEVDMTFKKKKKEGKRKKEEEGRQGREGRGKGREIKENKFKIGINWF